MAARAPAGTTTPQAATGDPQSPLWQVYLNDGPYWKDIPPETAALIEAELQRVVAGGARDHRVTHFTIKGRQYAVDAIRMVQTNTVTKVCRPVRRYIGMPGTGATALKTRWLWEDGPSGSGKFRPYDDTTCHLLNHHPMRMVIMNVGAFSHSPGRYYVDKQAMVQINITTGYQRRIMRCAGDRGSASAALPSTGALSAPSAPSAPLRSMAATAPLGPPASSSTAVRPDFSGRVVVDDVAGAGSNTLDPSLFLPCQWLDDDCPICLEPLRQDGRDVGTAATQTGQESRSVSMRDCVGHGFHLDCVLPCASNGALKVRQPSGKAWLMVALKGWALRRAFHLVTTGAALEPRFADPCAHLQCPVCSKTYGAPQTGQQPQ